jgi:hypothetical protein
MRCPLNRGLSRPQGQPGSCGKENNLLHLKGSKPHFLFDFMKIYYFLNT